MAVGQETTLMNVLNVGVLQIQSLQSLPALTCWYLWRERNQTIFEDKSPSARKVVYLSLLALKEHSQEKITPVRRTGTTQTNFGNVVGWFDGAASSSGLNSGAGGVIKISENCSYKWFINCGPGSNTRAELLGAWALLTLANRLSIQSMHLIGDSKIIIDWMRGKGRLHVISLDCWKERVSALISSFQKITFDHVFREGNREADNLSKLALQKTPGKLTYYQCIEMHEGPHLFLDLY
jgi:ribonuclease HI